jgi:hypothetical protein
MRKLIVTTFLTLDGVMQAPGGPEEDDSGGFAHGGWTYEIFAAYWPDAPEEAGSKPLNDATKYVASRSRPSLDWGPAVLIEGTRPRASRRSRRETGPSCRCTAAGTSPRR